MNETAPQHSRFRRFAVIYLVLLTVSCLVQFIEPPRSPSPADSEFSLETRFAEVEPVLLPEDDERVRVAYHEEGDGPAVLLLHGSPGSKRDFRHLQPILADQYRTVAVDLPGFGDSDKWIPDYSIRAQARYVLALMDALGIHRAHVFGFSMGAGVALNLADIAPERVRTLSFFGGIGVQEGEGSGDYHFEHFKYAVGFAGVVVAPELIPHFGLLGSRADRHAFIRSFWDTDQRPLRRVLEQLRVPLLLIHGRRDWLVPPRAAEEHHRIVDHSTLVMLDVGHFLLFSQQGSQLIADRLFPFLSAHGTGEAVPVRTTLDLSKPTEQADLPIDLTVSKARGPWWQVAVLAAATFASEDLTCIASGLLIRQAGLDPFVAVLGCTLGIFMGDVLLWLLGRLAGRRILLWGPVARRMPLARIDHYSDWIERHAGKLVLASRFMPGTRVPMYITAGILGRSSLRFLMWLLLAAILWTPLLVIGSAVVGPALVRPLERILGNSWLALGGGAVAFLLLLRTGELAWSEIGRARIAATVSRLWRWEFWPMSLFYLPLIPWFVYLSLRHRGLTTATAANPAIPAGGLVGESKADILKLLPGEWVVPTGVIEPGTVEERLAAFDQIVAEKRLEFPLILKPDVGQRGRGLKLVRSPEQVANYLQHEPATVIVQKFHPGPFEAGVFYYRFPNEPAGRIFSITDKHFPEVIGDGESTLELLIWRDRRLRMQARTFLTRHAGESERVPAFGERVRLAVAGNHCQGTMFRDGAHLITPALELRIDEIAKSAPGFFFGRFDVRYADADSFVRGEGFAIVELNGLASESTNIYDPAWSLLRAYAVLMRQWAIAFRIGSINRRAGFPTTPIREVLRMTLRHYRGRTSRALSD